MAMNLYAIALTGIAAVRLDCGKVLAIFESEADRIAAHLL